MKKKLLFMIMAIALILPCMAGCGGGDNTPETPQNPQTPQNPGTGTSPGGDNSTDTDDSNDNDDDSTDQGPVDPGPSDPGPSDPGPSDPGTTDPEPGDPGTNDPEPSDPGETVSSESKYKELEELIISKYNERYNLEKIFMIDVRDVRIQDSENVNDIYTFKTREDNLVWWGIEDGYFRKYYLSYNSVPNTVGDEELEQIIQTVDSAVTPGGKIFRAAKNYQISANNTWTLENSPDLIYDIANKMMGFDKTTDEILYATMIRRDIYNNVTTDIREWYIDATGDSHYSYIPLTLRPFEFEMLYAHNGKVYEYRNLIFTESENTVDAEFVHLLDEEVYLVNFKEFNLFNTYYRDNYAYEYSKDPILLGDIAQDYYTELLKTKIYKQLEETIITQATTIGQMAITDIRMIDISEDNKLTWWARNNNSQLSQYYLNKTLELTGNKKNDIEVILNALTTGVVKSDFVKQYSYTNDLEFINNMSIISNLKDKLVGSDYKILWGGLSDLSSSTYTNSTLGEYKTFNIDLLLEKDSKVYEYRDVIKVSTSINATTLYVGVASSVGVLNENYMVDSSIVELGEWAADYIAKQ